MLFSIKKCMLINKTPTLLPIQKDFYSVMISERKAKILDYSMKQLMKLNGQKLEQEEKHSNQGQNCMLFGNSAKGLFL